MLCKHILCCLISVESGKISMYFKSTVIILVWNVKQVNVYFIIMLSINKKKHYAQVLHYKMHKTQNEDKQNKNTSQ